MREQRSMGLNPVVLTSPKQGSASDGIEEIDGIRYYRTRCFSKNGSGAVPFLGEAQLIGRLSERIREVVEAEDIDILHSHSPSLNGLAALRAANKKKIPFVYEARAFWEDAAVNHGTFREGSLRYRLSQSVEMFLCKRAGRVITICEGMREDFVKRGCRPDHINVVPNGVDIDFFQPLLRDTELAAKYQLGSATVLGFIGSFYRYEGLRFLIDCLSALRAKLPEVKLLLVGGGYEAEMLKRLANSHGDAIVFTGQVPHEKIKAFYSILDVFVCPRERIRLTELVTPLKPLEAMGMGQAVLASDVGGHRELIAHDRTGLLYQAGSEENFVVQAVRAAKDPALRSRLGKEARAFVESERSWAKIVSRYPTIYEGLLRSRQSSKAAMGAD